MAPDGSTIEYDVPAGEAPADRCQYCNRPFTSEQSRILHVGHSHPDVCTDTEWDAFEDERDDEEYDLFTFHLKAAVSVFLIYFMFTFIYALVWVG